MNELLRQIPPIHELQKHVEIIKIKTDLNLSDKKITEVIQQHVNIFREQILDANKSINQNDNPLEILVKNICQHLLMWNDYKLKKVLNATGTILHTNLGRARLSNEAIQRVIEVAQNYTTLEYNISSGKRGSRHNIVEELIKEVTGAEAAIVVNNNAAAVYFILRSFAKNREVIVSRGELVEIGGSFRVSSIMEESDATLVEVGTTNKTHLHDYAEAICENTFMIMKIHTSNFKVVGFTHSVNRNELISLAHNNNLIYYEDLGSGALYDFSHEGIGEEPTVKTIIKEGPDLVSFSGDKLLGGPQVGIIAGKKECIEKLKKHQLARVLRVDKMTLAALEVTLKAYAKGSKCALMSIPTARDILKSPSFIKQRVLEFMDRLTDISKLSFTLKMDESMIGGGTMPEVKLETYGLIVHPITISVNELEKRLRNSKEPVITRIINDQLFLDFRTLSESDLKELFCILHQIDKAL